ncbi:MAG TPA: GNAT family N-acetyltransferase [Ferrovibrio sp.]|uniref:GNAT family N-acetyltransferase n=1 Tax=Ferrovibrio sp. TaxID=1917215 RepID=UPI002B4ABA70|nr:GNAT family N-acetyltransferase [Ferrovibrio sp.]HLT75876.1 GNAT family N-acetyltransferase [Ferrovibrio sp.]
MTEITIRPVAADDRARWEPLWLGYIAFYEKRLPQATTDFTWKRILDPANPIEALLAVDAQNNALGLVQYLLHESTWNTGGNVYLQDLFVVPEARGLRIGRRLIEAVAEISRKKGAGVLYWQTEEFNGTARRLYERLAKRAPFVRYNIEL